ncbi:hypothetical protein RND81_13G080600 [Saponaria officinalis]|uniref:Uncharacterized protein n=1 Tax=Saponaria officinalis TaxID=3572 RepID=A0AAW1GY56_SAPOF
MVTPLCLISSLTPSSTLLHPSTQNPPIILKFLKHHHRYTRGSPRFSISFSSGYKFHNQRNVPVIINKSEHDSESEAQEEYSVGVKAALSVLNFYKREISPLLPRSCRYVPTCSEYSMIAYKKYGFVKGTALTTWRLCRCNPLGGSGFDPRWFGEERPIEDRDR